MAATSQAQEVQQSLAEVQALLAHLETASWTEEDWEVLRRVLQSYTRLLETLVEAQMTLKRFQALLFGTRRRRHASGTSETPGSPGQAADEAAAGGTARAERATGAGGHRPGVGRLGAEAYVGATQVACRHEELQVGQVCPICGQGRLYALPPGVEIRIDGNALLSAIRYEVEKLRCSACGQVFRASLPVDAGPEKYSARARAVLALGRYYLGLPWYRMESYQAMLGVPVPDATQWEQSEHVADCGYVVFTYLERLAAQGELIYQDDTAVRILAFMAENAQTPAPERIGMYTTALVVKVGEQTICLYYAGRAHAGENLKALLTQRAADQEPPLVMSDALASNEADDTRLIRCHCLAHGRRKFSELEEVFPVECRLVLDALAQVFDHDEEARARQMNAAERLAYHQAASQPLMEALERWLTQQSAERLIEPNSSLGKAIAYLLGHWETLTRFLTVPGAPLENNLAERALKLFIRQRKNSLFYRTEHSAYIASVLTSLIATCLHAGVNAFAYLVALQEHRAEVVAHPAAWVPWAYQAQAAPP